MADNWFSKAVRPLERNFRSFLTGSTSRNVSPTSTVGAAGTAVFGGYVVENEKDGSLADREKYRTYSNILANCAVAAAGVRYFLNLAAKAEWIFTPTDHPQSEELSKLAEKMLMEDPRTPWARIVRRACMYRFYGFSMQEWTMRRDDDGRLTFDDIAPRAQITIERWDINTDGSVNGVVQRSPQDQREIYLPRGKVVYLVDDSLNDSPQGLGLFRHIVEPAKRLQRYEQLEGFGYETDLRGTPVARAPYAELRRQVNAGNITQADAQQIVAGIEGFMKKHIRSPELGIMLDSDVYTTIDDAARPSGQPKFDVKLLEANSNGLAEVANAIERLNHEIARVLGVEAILLGGGERGSFALSEDKTNQFLLVVNATLMEVADAFEHDLLDVLWELNGWPEEAKPKMRPKTVQFRELEQMTRALRDLAGAGAILMPDDPAVTEIRGMMGLSAPIEPVDSDENLMLPNDQNDPNDEGQQ